MSLEFSTPVPTPAVPEVDHCGGRDPGPDPSESLDYADRVVADEHRVLFEGRHLGRSTEDEGDDDTDDR